MRGKFKSVVLINFLIMIFACISEANQCSILLSQTEVGQKLRIAAYNLERFYIRSPADLVNRPKDVFKSQRLVRGNIKAIKSISPDIWLATEIDDYESLRVLSETYLDGEYDYVYVEGASSRSLMVLFYKKKLGLKVEVKSHSDLSVLNPLNGREEPAFVQDFPIFTIKKENSSDPGFAIGGVHFKSERDRPNDKSSYLKRLQEADLATEIIKGFKIANPDIPIIVMGDFNAAQGVEELKGFSQDLKFIDPFRYDFEDPYEMSAYTHSYHNENGETSYSSPDRVFIDPMIAGEVIIARVHRYRDRKGNIKPLPKSIDDRRRNPSDHYPIYFDIKL